MRMIKLGLLPPLLTLVLLASPVAAQDSGISDPPLDQKIYDIELILFKNISVPSSKELNLPSPSPAYSQSTLEFSNAEAIEKARLQGFSALANDELQLHDLVRSIVNSSRYGLLTHIGWRQPGLEREKRIPVWVKGGQIFGNSYSSIDQSDTQRGHLIDPGNSALSDLESKPVGDVLYEIEGQIILTLSRYLHTQANLVLRKPADTEGRIQHSENPTGNDMTETREGQLLLNYGMNEERRMRSKKLHYLDHPNFGMLVLITPYEKIPEQLNNAAPAEPIASEN